MIKKLLLVFVFILGSLATVQAAKKMIVPDANGVLFVKKNVVGGDQSGSSWANAMTELADALKMAKEMNDVTAGTVKEIWVAAGTYKPKYDPVTFTGANRDNTFLLVKDVKLYGGLAGTETVVNATTPTAGESILSGDFNDDDVTTGSGVTLAITNNLDNAYHVLLSVGAVGTAQISNFTITAGNADGLSNLIVGGLSIYNNVGGGLCSYTSSPTVTNCLFTQNAAYDGGGIFGYSFSLTVIGSTFKRNTAMFGGGIAIDNTSDYFIKNCVFEDNKAIRSGGGFNAEDSDGKIVNSLFVFNSAFYGGGLINFDKKLTLVNTTFSANNAGNSGGAIYNNNVSLQIYNSIVFGNKNRAAVDNIYNTGTKVLDIQNSIIEGYTATTNGNLDATGMTLASIFKNPAAGDYSLKTASPAINTGRNALFPNLNLTTSTDLAGNLRVKEAIIDMGAYESLGPLEATQNQTNVICAGATTGEATVVPSGGIAPYTYLWSNGATTASITGITNGNYSVKITDAANTAITKDFTILVTDTEKPVVRTKNASLTLDVNGQATLTVADIDNGSTDNCTIASYTLDKDTFDCSHVGANPLTNTVTLTVTDVNGNSDTATAVVTVEDKIKPVVKVQDITVQLDAAGMVVISAENDIDNGSTDNCTIASYTLDKDTFDCSNVGANPLTNTVTLTVTDVNGNSDTATAVVTVEDKIKPVVKVQDITVQLDAAGTVTIAERDIDNGSTDNCTIASYTLDKDTFDCSNVGANPLTNTVTLTVTDVNGNSDTATAVVTVEDKINPVAITKNFTAQLNAAGTVTISAENDINNGSTDNCTIASYTLNKDTFDCSNVGANTVTLTVTDVNGNRGTATAVVTVEDKINPVAITKNFTAQLNAAGTVTISAENDINNGSTDNCTIASYTLDKDTFGCADIGTNTVQLTVADATGNTDFATATVTILPLPAPIVNNTHQLFCVEEQARISDIEIVGSGLEWYTSDTSTVVVSPTTLLGTGTYYVATRYGNCYSNRTAVTITVNDTAPPTGNNIQFSCLENPATVASLVTNETEVLWYSSAIGGQPLSATTILEDQQFYYASYVGGDCESSQRFAVQVTVRHCDVNVFNAVSANNDGKNDYLQLGGISEFPDNTVEIFNQWGQLVFKTKQYGAVNDNVFRGYANVGTNQKSGTVLPFGTYYYVIQFVNHDKQNIQKSGYLHLNN